MRELLKIAVSLLPVFLFLGGLVIFDSYKLVKLRAVLRAIALGCGVALAAYYANSWLLLNAGWSRAQFIRYVAPATEELLKALYLVYLIRGRRVGFMVDAAVYGFAVGAGFAFVENIFYLQTVAASNVFVWIVRGFGTAVMHGTTTAIFGILSQNRAERRGGATLLTFLPGLLAAMIVHAFYNHFFLPPILITMAFVVGLPMLAVVVFERSEQATRNWLGVGFDTDVDLLSMIISGNIGETRIGRYLQSLKARFPGEVVADMLCYLRIHLELAVRAKGTLLMRENGFKVELEPEIKAKFEELKYLEKSLGKTGKLAILPILHTSHRDLWQIYMLN